MGKRRAWGAFCGILLGFSACARFDPHPTIRSQGAENTDVGGSIEVFSWWTSGGEREAFKALLDVHESRVPDASVTNAVVEFADKARDQLSTRLSTGNPPELFQANSGTDLFNWVQTNGLDDSASVVEDLTELSEALGWKEAFHEDVYDAVTHEGKLFGVPANVHRINTLYYRKDLFERFKLSPPETLDDLIELCQQIANDSQIQESSPDGKMACLGLGGKWDWTFSLMTFEMILPAIAGPEFYERYFLGRERPLPGEIRQSLDTALYLYCGGETTNCLSHSWFNDDIHERTWDEGVRKLTEGKALMAPMGDWAKGFLESDDGGNLEAGKDFDAIPFPGTSDIFVFTADCMTMPRGAANRDGARSLLRTLASKEGQLAFNQLKGSIPARTDIDPKHLDAMQQATLRAFQDSVKVRALSGLIPSYARELLHPEISRSLREESTETISRFLRLSYPLD